MHPFSVNERVENIKDDEQEINRLIEEYKPFIASCVEKATGRYVRYGEDDELSIGLMAFVEAVKSYDRLKGNFLSFAHNVIRRRLIDYYRKEKKHCGTISLNGSANDGDGETELGVEESIYQYSVEEISEYRRLELEELKKELWDWGITFFELVNVSPKHERTRRAYIKIIQFLMSQSELIDTVKQKRYLPIAEIEKGTGVPRKTIERGRKYIIAVLIILTGDYQYIKDFVDWGVGE
ncbi:MAG: RNA polymerase sigma factor SigI [Clostridiales bacterium]|jgi:RNA polymerase sigma factor|nr:RNA polymerase sigma factor SigI [Eubacteriales bacterium]MDH7566268.1 RNA polymerase sigma factor SigI [Clostridiales bacterium]